MSRTNRSRIIPIVTIVVGLIMIGSAAFLNFFYDEMFPNTPATPPSTSQDIPRITPNDAKKAFDSGDAVFIDVRDSESFNAGHIPGALLIPLNELTVRIDEIPKASLIIPY